MLGLNEKHILKKSFQGILPEGITNRSKHPYRAPIKQSLLNKKTAAYTREMLSERSLKKAGLFDINKVTRLLQKLQTANTPGEIDSMALVGVLSSQLIYHQFVENFPRKADYSISPSLIVDRRSKALERTG
ncbi:MAG TPA: hypothetical protein ENH40_05190 [Nitrospirae bacterium]|nr:hypothetical protein [Nitrospirota bacterium]